MVNYHFLAKPQPFLKPPPEQPKKTVPTWWTILVNIGLAITEVAIDIAASTFLGPVGAVIASTSSEILLNFTGDLLTGNNPFETTNLLFNIGLPFLQLPNQIKSAKKLSKSKLNNMSDFMPKAEADLLRESAEELRNMKWNSKVGSKMFNGDNDFNFKKFEPYFDVEKVLKNEAKNFNDILKKSELKSTKFALANKSLKQINKYMRFVDTRYATKALTDKLTRKVQKKIDNFLSDNVKRFKNKLFKNSNRAKTRAKIIPLNHTKAPWVKGIKIFQVPNAFNYYNVSVYFDRKLTNGKKPVILWNKTWLDVNAFMTSSSAGQFYLWNIAWGWQVGSMLRKGESFGLNLTKPLFSTIGFISKNSYNIISSVNSIINMTLRLDDTLEKWTDPNQFISGFVDGAVNRISGSDYIVEFGKSIATKNSSVFKNFVIRKTSSKLFSYGAKKARNKQKWKGRKW